METGSGGGVEEVRGGRVRGGGVRRISQRARAHRPSSSSSSNPTGGGITRQVKDDHVVTVYNKPQAPQNEREMAKKEDNNNIHNHNNVLQRRESQPKKSRPTVADLLAKKDDKTEEPMTTTCSNQRLVSHIDDNNIDDVAESKDVEETEDRKSLRDSKQLDMSSGAKQVDEDSDDDGDDNNLTFQQTSRGNNETLAPCMKTLINSNQGTVDHDGRDPLNGTVDHDGRDPLNGSLRQREEELLKQISTNNGLTSQMREEHDTRTNSIQTPIQKPIETSIETGIETGTPEQRSMNYESLSPSSHTDHLYSPNPHISKPTHQSTSSSTSRDQFNKSNKLNVIGWAAASRNEAKQLEQPELNAHINEDENNENDDEVEEEEDNENYDYEDEDYDDEEWEDEDEGHYELLRLSDTSHSKSQNNQSRQQQKTMSNEEILMNLAETSRNECLRVLGSEEALEELCEHFKTAAQSPLRNHHHSQIEEEKEKDMNQNQNQNQNGLESELLFEKVKALCGNDKYEAQHIAFCINKFMAARIGLTTNREEQLHVSSDNHEDDKAAEIGDEIHFEEYHGTSNGGDYPCEDDSLFSDDDIEYGNIVPF